MPAPGATFWDVYEEHLDEAAFLWGEWEDALVAANYQLLEVAAGPEARLLAHLDGLVLGRAGVAQELLLPALACDEPGRIASAAWALVECEANGTDEADGAGDHQAAVVEALVKAPAPARAAIARALRLTPRCDLGRVARLWHDGSPAVRAVVFDLVAAGEPGWASAHYEPVLGGADSPARAAALRALRRAPDRALVGLVEGALKTELKEVRREAMVTGIMLGVPAAWDACRRVAIRAGDGCRLPLALLAVSDRPSDRQVVLSLAKDAKVKRHAVWALGFAGDLAAADALVEAIGDDAVARVAGESLSAITGVAIEGPLVMPPEDGAPDDAEVGDADPPSVVRAEDHLPRPHPTAVKSWWQRDRARFASGTRYIAGQARTPAALRAALATATMWRREVLALELAVVTGAGAVDVRIWAQDQLQALTQAAAVDR